MRLAAATVALAVLGGGCLPISARGGWVLTATGAGVGALGAAIAYDADAPVSSMLKGSVPGLVIMAIGLFYVLENREPPPEPAGEREARIERETRPFRDMRAQQREAAWQLTKEAQHAAREGNCARVIELDANVKAMDEELYASTFITDVAIQRCVGSLVP